MPVNVYTNNGLGSRCLERPPPHLWNGLSLEISSGKSLVTWGWFKGGPLWGTPGCDRGQTGCISSNILKPVENMWIWVIIRGLALALLFWFLIFLCCHFCLIFVVGLLYIVSILDCWLFYLFLKYKLPWMSPFRGNKSGYKSLENCIKLYMHKTDDWIRLFMHFWVHF